MRLALLASALLPGGPSLDGLALARPQAADPPAAGFTGTLRSVDALSVVVRADDGGLVSFAVEDPFSVPPGLVAGTRVTVRHEAREDGSLRVVRVEVTPISGDYDSTTEPPRPTRPAAAPPRDQAATLEPEPQPVAALPVDPATVEPVRQPVATVPVDRVTLEPTPPPQPLAAPRVGSERTQPQPTRPLAPHTPPVRPFALALLLFVGLLLLLGGRLLRAG